MLGILKTKSIKLQILVVAITMVVLVCSVLLLTQLMITNLIYNKNVVYAVETTKKIKVSVTSNIQMLNSIILNICYNDNIQEYLSDNGSNSNYDLYKKVDMYIQNMNILKDGIVSTILLDLDYNCYNINVNSHALGEIKEFVKEIPDRSGVYYSELKFMNTDIYSSQKYPFIFAGIPVYLIADDEEYYEKIGYVVMIIDSEALLSQMSGELKQVETKIQYDYYIISRNDKIYNSNKQTMIGEKLGIPIQGLSTIQKKYTDNVGIKYLLNIDKIDEIGGYIVCAFPEKELAMGVDEVKKISYIAFVIIILFLYIPYKMLVENIVRPMVTFVNFINNFRKSNRSMNNFKPNLNIEGYAEINMIAQEFNKSLADVYTLSNKLLDSTKRIYELEISKKQAEIQFLKSQINPHFLYNTLESVKTLALQKDAYEIRDIAAALGHIYRYSIKGSDLVGLMDEIDVVKSYIRIQQIRFKDRFDVIYEFPPEIMDFKIIKMVLQPIVENAIFHGIEPSMNKCLLSIGGKLEGTGGAIIWVKDTGVGMNEEILENIHAELAQDNTQFISNSSLKTHIGILNINNRFRLLYGDSYKMTMSSLPGKGTEVILKIPCFIQSDDFSTEVDV